MSATSILSPKGFKTGGINCGIKKHKKDLAIIYSEIPASAAGVFTHNKIQASPVRYTKSVVNNGILQAIVINSGNANAVTGSQGDHDVLEIARYTSNSLKIDITKVAVASTGRIGVPLPMKSVLEGIDYLSKRLKYNAFLSAAEAIRTTDTFTKAVSKKVIINGTEIIITAIAKGAGMIQPNMATMLCFICTDAFINSRLLNKLLTNSVNQSFNCISIDGCTSTNDTVLALANGLAKNPEINKLGDEYNALQKEFNDITKTLAKMIVKDGEGATKLIEINVLGSQNEMDAKKIAFAVANSPLLKSSFYGESLNWGRIIGAVGASGAFIDPDKVNIYLEDIVLLSGGQPVQFSNSDTEYILKQDEIKVKIDLNLGRSCAIVWTCDLSPKYVKINMD